MSTGESSAKRPPRTEGNRGGRGRGSGGRHHASSSSGPANADTATSSLPFALPKDLLGNCVGRSVLVTLSNGHEVTGILEQFDEDCNLMLVGVKHYLVEVVETGSSSDAQVAAAGSSSGFAFKSDSTIDVAGAPKTASTAFASDGTPFAAGAGSVRVKSIERTRLLRECQRIILAGANVLGIAPTAQLQ